MHLAFTLLPMPCSLCCLRHSLPPSLPLTQRLPPLPHSPAGVDGLAPCARWCRPCAGYGHELHLACAGCDTCPPALPPPLPPPFPPPFPPGAAGGSGGGGGGAALGGGAGDPISTSGAASTASSSSSSSGTSLTHLSGGGGGSHAESSLTGGVIEIGDGSSSSRLGNGQLSGQSHGASAVLGGASGITASSTTSASSSRPGGEQAVPEGASSATAVLLPATLLAALAAVLWTRRRRGGGLSLRPTRAAVQPTHSTGDGGGSAGVQPVRATKWWQPAMMPQARVLRAERELGMLEPLSSVSAVASDGLRQPEWPGVELTSGGAGPVRRLLDEQ